MQLRPRYRLKHESPNFAMETITYENDCYTVILLGSQSLLQNC